MFFAWLLPPTLLYNELHAAAKWVVMDGAVGGFAGERVRLADIRR
jgi:hypothetical protein